MAIGAQPSVPLLLLCHCHSVHVARANLLLEHLEVAITVGIEENGLAIPAPSSWPIGPLFEGKTLGASQPLAFVFELPDIDVILIVEPDEEKTSAIGANPDFSSYFAPELAVRSKRQITKGIGNGRGNEEAVEWKTVCVAPDQSVFSAFFAKRANAVRDRRSILARTALSLRFCLVAAL